MFVALFILAATVVSAASCCPAAKTTCSPQQPAAVICPAPSGAGPVCPAPCPTVKPTCPPPCPPVKPAQVCPAPCPVVTPTCPPVRPAQVCPPPCPTVAPTCPPVAQTCPAQCPSEACIIATQTQPAGIGAGPAPILATQSGPCFDAAFIKTMSQQHVDVAALSTIGITQACDKSLRDLAGKIRYEQTKQKEKLDLWNCQLGLGPIPLDYNRTQSVVQYLSCLQGQEFDVAFAKTMIGYLQQSQDAAQLALCNGCMKGLQDQAKIVVRSTQNEILALQRWLDAQCR